MLNLIIICLFIILIAIVICMAANGVSLFHDICRSIRGYVTGGGGNDETDPIEVWNNLVSDVLAFTNNNKKQLPNNNRVKTTFSELNDALEAQIDEYNKLIIKRLDKSTKNAVKWNKSQYDRTVADFNKRVHELSKLIYEVKNDLKSLKNVDGNSVGVLIVLTKYKAGIESTMKQMNEKFNRISDYLGSIRQLKNAFEAKQTVVLPQQISVSPAPSSQQISVSPSVSPQKATQISMIPAPLPQQISVSPAPSSQQISVSPAPASQQKATQISMIPAPLPQQMSVSLTPLNNILNRVDLLEDVVAAQYTPTWDKLNNLIRFDEYPEIYIDKVKFVILSRIKNDYPYIYTNVHKLSPVNKSLADTIGAKETQNKLNVLLNEFLDEKNVTPRNFAHNSAIQRYMKLLSMSAGSSPIHKLITRDEINNIEKVFAQIKARL